MQWKETSCARDLTAANFASVQDWNIEVQTPEVLALMKSYFRAIVEVTGPRLLTRLQSPLSRNRSPSQKTVSLTATTQRSSQRVGCLSALFIPISPKLPRLSTARAALAY